MNAIRSYYSEYYTVSDLCDVVSRQIFQYHAIRSVKLGQFFKLKARLWGEGKKEINYCSIGFGNILAEKWSNFGVI
jgi:hypothetical protein